MRAFEFLDKFDTLDASTMVIDKGLGYSYVEKYVETILTLSSMVGEPVFYVMIKLFNKRMKSMNHMTSDHIPVEHYLNLQTNREKLMNTLMKLTV